MAVGRGRDRGEEQHDGHEERADRDPVDVVRDPRGLHEGLPRVVRRDPDESGLDAVRNALRDVGSGLLEALDHEHGHVRGLERHGVLVGAEDGPVEILDGAAEELLERRRADHALGRALDQGPGGDQVRLPLDDAVGHPRPDQVPYLPLLQRADRAAGEAVGAEKLAARVRRQLAHEEKERRDHDQDRREDSATARRYGTCPSVDVVARVFVLLLGAPLSGLRISIGFGTRTASRGWEAERPRSSDPARFTLLAQPEFEPWPVAPTPRARGAKGGPGVEDRTALALT